MSWRPNTLLELLEAGDDSPLREVTDRHWPQPRYICPCGAAIQAFRIIDCRHLPFAPQAWACDGCWTKWRRSGVKVDDGSDITSSREWSTRWLTAHSAPQDQIDKIALTRDKPIGRQRSI